MMDWFLFGQQLAVVVFFFVVLRFLLLALMSLFNRHKDSDQ